MTTRKSKPKANPGKGRYAHIVEVFKHYKIGEHFFVPDVAMKDLAMLRVPFKRAGVDCSMAVVVKNGVTGVAVTRLEGEWDEI